MVIMELSFYFVAHNSKDVSFLGLVAFNALRLVSLFLQVVKIAKTRLETERPSLTCQSSSSSD